MDLQSVRAVVQDATRHSMSDIRQDVMALAVSGFKKNGYFVEFGALDGIKGSNTLMLERDYDWVGVLAEPAICWRESIIQNRSCIFDPRAVTAKTGQRLTFKETEAHLGLSGLVDFFNSNDMHSSTRSTSSGPTYEVETVSLNDMLDQHGVPAFVDYISVDTEGSELTILEAFDFSRRRVGLWTVEHNYMEDTRAQIYDLMTKNGYSRVLEDLSYIDDWYVQTSTLSIDAGPHFFVYRS